MTPAPIRPDASDETDTIGVGAVTLVLLVLLALLVLPGVAQAPARDGAYRGYVAARLADDGSLEVVRQSNADRLFVPASVLKIVTVAATLEHLGPGYRWTTRVTSAAAIDDSRLTGDLILEPGADPTWNTVLRETSADGALRDLARGVRAHGITRVGGDLVVAAGRFPGRMHPVDRGYGDLPFRYGTPPAALALDDATVPVRVAPGSGLGAPAVVETPTGLEVVNLTTTVGRDRDGAGTLDFVPVWDTDTLLLRGEYPIGEPAFTVDATDPAPVWRAARRLRAALADAGVTVDGDVVVRRDAPAGDRTLAEVRSPPLSEVLPRVLRESHNWTADMLALTLGFEVAGSGRFDDGVAVVGDFATRVLDQQGIPTVEARLEDGSGLSPGNLLTPRAIVGVLAYALGRPWGPALLDALGGPGEGTLESWPPLPALAGKTGTLQHTVGLAGVLRHESDDPILFCYLVNHHSGPAAVARREIAAALGRW